MALLLSAGCDEINAVIDNTLYKGTLKGVQLCVDRNETDILSRQDIRTSCASKHEKSMPNVYVTGEAHLITYARPNRTRFYGRIENGSATFVIGGPVVVTSVTVTAYYYDSDGKMHSFSYPLKGIWIEPGKSHSFSTDIEDNVFKHEKHPGWCLKKFKKRKERQGCLTWDRSGVHGVEVSTN